MNYIYREDDFVLELFPESSKDIADGIISDLLEKEKLFFKKIRKVSMDFRYVKELNSLIISELISIYNKFKKINPNFEFCLLRVNPQVYNVLQLVNVDVYFTIEVS